MRFNRTVTYPNEPEVLTDEWFGVFEQVAEHCRKLDMKRRSQRLYALDWQGSPNSLYDRLIYRDKETQSRTIHVGAKRRVAVGEKYATSLSQDLAAKKTMRLFKSSPILLTSLGVLTPRIVFRSILRIFQEKNRKSIVKRGFIAKR